MDDNTGELLHGDWLDPDLNAELDNPEIEDQNFDEDSQNSIPPPPPPEESAAITFAGENATSAAKKRGSATAKPVEWRDMEGNLIQVFPSGQAASRSLKHLKITQSDISMCCSGRKASINGYIFRFQNSGEDEGRMRLKRGYGYVMDNPDTPVMPTRQTRASRGEHSLGAPGRSLAPVALLAPPTLKARRFVKTKVKVGLFFIEKYLPVDSTVRSEELKNFQQTVDEYWKEAGKTTKYKSSVTNVLKKRKERNMMDLGDEGN